MAKGVGDQMAAAMLQRLVAAAQALSASRLREGTPEGLYAVLAALSVGLPSGFTGQRRFW